MGCGMGYTLTENLKMSIHPDNHFFPIFALTWPLFFAGRSAALSRLCPPLIGGVFDLGSDDGRVFHLTWVWIFQRVSDFNGTRMMQLLTLTLIIRIVATATETAYQRSRNISSSNFEYYKTRTMTTRSEFSVEWFCAMLFPQVTSCVHSSASNIRPAPASVTPTALTTCPCRVRWPASRFWRIRIQERPQSPSWQTWVLSTVWRWG